MKSTIYQVLRYSQLRRCFRDRMPTLISYRRLLCSKAGDSNSSKGDSNETTPEGHYIPFRIRKRLKQKGLSVSDIEYRPEKKPAEHFLQQTLEGSTVEKEIKLEFPSDAEKLKWLRSQERHSYRPPGIDPQDTSILLFPGQGSQFVGMGKQLLAYPGVEDIYKKASEILEYDLLSLCLSGPKSELDKTLYCQPAVVVTSLAAMEKLKTDYPKVLEQCVGLAGFSVGEFTALVVSGMLSFEDAMLLIKLRAAAMQTASERVPSGMLTVFCDHKTNLRTAMVAAKAYCREKLGMEEPVCRVANYLCTDVKVVAGNDETIEFLEKYGKEFGIQRTKRLPVSGAFHTELMFGGRQFYKFWDAWDNVELKEPLFKLHSNMDGKPLFWDPKKSEHVKYIFRKQMLRPVAWEQTMHILYSRRQGLNFPKTFEVGPGRQLGYLLQKTNLKAFAHYSNIEC